MKKRWQAKMKAAGKDYKNPGPNVVFGANAQVAIEKFARYFDIEERLVPISTESRFCMDPKKAIEMVDENTIGVIVILGSTYTGHYEPVKEMAALLDDYQKKTGIDIPIHVDGASGAMVAPFTHPELEWDFRVPRVKSINTSGHKFGMAVRAKLSLCEMLLADPLHFSTSVSAGSSSDQRMSCPRSSFSSFSIWDQVRNALDGDRTITVLT